MRQKTPFRHHRLARVVAVADDQRALLRGEVEPGAGTSAGWVTESVSIPALSRRVAERERERERERETPGAFDECSAVL
jgi:hypothetical protein